MIRIFIISIALLLPEFSNSEKAYSRHSDQQEPLLSFGVVSDIQYCDCETTGVRFYGHSLVKLRAAVSDFNKLPLSFVINLGDLIDRDVDSYNMVLPLLDSIDSQVYHVLGNHDFEVEESQKKSVYSKLETGPGYYAFEYDNFCFIALNSNDLSTYSPYKRKRDESLQLIEEIKEAKGINAYEWNGGIGQKQMKWLNEKLEEANQKEQKVILFSHHPVWPQSRHNILNYLEMMDLLSNFDNVIGWFCGHDHNGGYGNFNNVHCVNFKGMVDTEFKNSYALVELYENKIWIKGYGREKSQILAY